MFVLVGYLSDVAGLQSDLFTVPPVVRDETGVLWVGNLEGWFPEEATRLEAADHDAVTDLAPTEEIRVGQAIWMIGPNAHSTISSVIDEPNLRREMVRWELAPFGFRWKIGTHAEFLGFSQYIAGQASLLTRRWLSGVESETRGRLAARLYATLENVEEHRRLPLLGVIAGRDLDGGHLKLLAMEFRSVVPLWRCLLAPFTVRRWAMDFTFRRHARRSLEGSRAIAAANGRSVLTSTGIVEVLALQLDERIGDGYRLPHGSTGRASTPSRLPMNSVGFWRDSGISNDPMLALNTDEVEAYANGSRR